MAERIVWRDVRPGDVLDIRNMRWTVLAWDGARATLRGPNGQPRAGQPDPDTPVTALERGPEPTEAARSALAVLKPEPLCAHWIGAEGRYCGSDQEVRSYQQGRRCAEHTPARLTGKPEPPAPTRPCAKCGQLVQVAPGQKCLVCGTPTTREATKGRRK